MKNIFKLSSALFLLTALHSLVPNSVNAQEPVLTKCTYSADHTSLKVEWTGFKTTKRTGVKGSFKTVESLKKNKPKQDLVKLLKGLKASVSGLSVDTGNPARDLTLNDHFFKLFKLPEKITGSISGVEASDQGGAFDLFLKFNGVSKKIPMKFTLTEHSLNSKTLVAKGGMDILNYKGQAALQELNKNCFELHKGEDGVSKTWSEVELEISFDIVKHCK